MTERLYYHDSFLYEFDAEVSAIQGSSASGSGAAVVLDRTAFYPTSGGQVFDTGWIVPADSETGKIRVVEVAERDDGTILHLVEGNAPLQPGTRIRGLIDADRRRDHIQQHSGQHVLSAGFVRLFDMATVSFHMGADACSIDLDTKSLTTAQVEAAEGLANDIVQQNRPVAIRFVTQEEAKHLGVRKLPPVERDRLRLIEVQDFDLTACGGTHVAATGQIGCILLRKTQKSRQGCRVEFVCGKRAVGAARHDYTTLTESAGLLSAHIREVPQQIRKLQDESRGARKSRELLLEELAEHQARTLVAETPENNGRKVVERVFQDRDAAYIKLLAQKLTRQYPNVIALLGAKSGQPTLVFARSAQPSLDMGALMKEILAELGGRGGGSPEMAQGAPQKAEGMEPALTIIAARLRE